MKNGLVDADKGRGLNLAALKKHGTLEFRLFNGTMDTKEIKKAISFVHALVVAVKTKDEKLIKLLEKVERKEKVSFDDFLNVLGIDVGPRSRLKEILFNASKLLKP